MDKELRPAGFPSRIIVADDHPLFRDAVRRMLDAQPDLKVVGEAADGKEAVELCRRLQPDLVLIDVQMPRMDGLEATWRIKREFPRTNVLVFTAFADPDYLSEALEAGAAGYVLKGASITEMINAVRKVLAGESPLNQEVATRLLMRLTQEVASEERVHKVEARSGLLSSRETDVLRLAARGNTNQQIARELRISVSTVKKHLHNVISKLEVSDRTQAAVRAFELGVLDGHEEE